MRDREFVNPQSVAWSRAAFLAAGVAVFTVAGCHRGPQMAQVTGKVVYNGQPLTFGTVAFQPPSGQPAVGDIQSDGTFALSTYRPGDGAVVGKHRVRVACYESQRPGTKPTGGEQALGKSLIPLNYTLFDQSGLTAEVQAGENQPIVLELKGPGK